MKTHPVLSQTVRFAAVALNGLSVVFWLFIGLVSMAADVGASTARARLGWSFLLAVASVAVIAALASSDRHRGFVRASYGATGFLLIASIWEWYELFNSFTELSPPEETVVLGGLALVNTAALVLNRPLRLAPLRENQRARNALITGVVVCGVIAALEAAVLVERISGQYPHAQHFLRLGGNVRWERGWVRGVYLKGTGTADDDLRHLRHFPKLRSLYLSDTAVTDAGLAHIAELRSLRSLYLDNTAVTDRGLRHISGLTNLRNLWLHGTEVTDEGLAHLEGMTEMGYLDLGNTEVTDAGLSRLYGMKELYYLHLPGTDVTKEGLRRIATEIPSLSAYNGRVHTDELENDAAPQK